MGMAQMPGGGRRYNEDTVRAALFFLAAVVILFFLLLVRLYFDHRAGRTVKFTPVRNPSGLIRAVLDERS